MALTFEPERAELVLTAPNEHPAAVEHLTLGGPYPGLDVAEPLPEDFDWHSADSVRISVYAAPTAGGRPPTLPRSKHGLPTIRPTPTGSKVRLARPPDVAAQDGATFLATCTTDPARSPWISPYSALGISGIIVA